MPWFCYLIVMNYSVRIGDTMDNLRFGLIFASTLL